MSHSRILTPTTVLRPAVDSLWGFQGHRNQRQSAHEVFLQVHPEGLVSEAVHHGADGAWQNADDDVTCEQVVRTTVGEKVAEKRFQQRVCVRQHAQQQLEPMEQDGVSGLLGIHAGCPDDEKYVEVCVEQGQPNDDQQQHVGDFPLAEDVRVAEHHLPHTEDPCAEERYRLGGQGGKQVWEDGECTCGPDQSDEEVGSPHGADAGVVQWETHCHVALECHAGEVEWRVFGAEEGQ